MVSCQYDSEIGRFVSADDVGVLDVQNDLHDKNPYAYCDNNPVSRLDKDFHTYFVGENGVLVHNLCRQTTVRKAWKHEREMVAKTGREAVTETVNRR